MGVNLDVGQNLNFAVPCNEVHALLVTASQQPKLLDSVVGHSDNSFAGIVWTSITSGRDYTIKQDGDYLCTSIGLVFLSQLRRRVGSVVPN
jgi:hypothetical protein